MVTLICRQSEESAFILIINQYSFSEAHNPSVMPPSPLPLRSVLLPAATSATGRPHPFSNVINLRDNR